MRVTAFAHDFRFVSQCLAVGAAVFFFVGRNAATGGISASLGVAHGILLKAGNGMPEWHTEKFDAESNGREDGLRSVLATPVKPSAEGRRASQGKIHG